MTSHETSSAQRRRLARMLAVLGLLGALGAVSGGPILIWAVALYTGHTPDEVLTYAQWRVSDRPKIRVFTDPLLPLVGKVLGVEPGISDADWVVPPAGGKATAPSLEELIRGPASQTTRQIEDLANRARPVLKVGPTHTYKTIRTAVAAAAPNSIIEIEPGDYRADTAVFDKDNITVRPSQNGAVRLIADGASAEEKAIWVVRRGSLHVSGLSFIGAKVADKNGAGIRLERGTLTVRGCLFHGNENGILTANFNDAQLDVSSSEFSFNGHGDGYSHHVYVGTIARARLVGNYLHHGNKGHLIKSRAQNTIVAFNRITDEKGGRASYEIDLPNGGDALLMGNVIQQSRTASHSTLVAYGLEGYRPSVKNRLVMLHNTMINNHPRGGTMVRVAPGGDRKAHLVNNLYVGAGTTQPRGAALLEVGNAHASLTDLSAPDSGDYRLRTAEGFTAQRVPDGLIRTIAPLLSEPAGWVAKPRLPITVGAPYLQKTGETR